MKFDQLLFGTMYRVGLTPWEGHALPERLKAVVEGDTALLPGRALDVGCGTGDTAIYLAGNGWDVTAVDLVNPPLAKAREKARTAGVRVRFLPADATQLRKYPVAPGFGLIVDSACLHTMSDTDRDAYVGELEAVAAPGCRLLVFAFAPGNTVGPRGIGLAEIERRFGERWEMLGNGLAEGMSLPAQMPVHFYDLRRR